MAHLRVSHLEAAYLLVRHVEEVVVLGVELVQVTRERTVMPDEPRERRCETCAAWRPRPVLPSPGDHSAGPGSRLAETWGRCRLYPSHDNDQDMESQDWCLQWCAGACITEVAGPAEIEAMVKTSIRQRLPAAAVAIGQRVVEATCGELWEMEGSYDGCPVDPEEVERIVIEEIGKSLGPGDA